MSIRIKQAFVFVCALASSWTILAVLQTVSRKGSRTELVQADTNPRTYLEVPDSDHYVHDEHENVTESEAGNTSLTGSGYSQPEVTLTSQERALNEKFRSKFLKFVGLMRNHSRTIAVASGKPVADSAPIPETLTSFETSQSPLSLNPTPEVKQKTGFLSWVKSFFSSQPKTPDPKVPLLPKDFWEVENSHQFVYINDEPSLCRSSESSIVVMVLSSVDHFEQRRRVRETWGRSFTYKQHASVTVFLLGRTNNDSIQYEIEREMAAHGDIVQESFSDTYRHLSFKTLMGLKWATTHCPWARYIYKLDDDKTGVNFQKMVSFLLSHPRDDSLLACHYKFQKGAKPHRFVSSRWHVKPSEYPEMFYPESCRGSDGYVMTIDVARRLYAMSLSTKLFWLEDIYITGILRQRLADVPIMELPH